MKTRLPAQRMMVWMSWWERRKASRATTTPATWILPSSGQYSFRLTVNTLSATVCGILYQRLWTSVILIDCMVPPQQSSAVFAQRQRLISKLFWLCPLALTGGCIPAVSRLVDSGSVVSANTAKGPLNQAVNPNCFSKLQEIPEIIKLDSMGNSDFP